MKLFQSTMDRKQAGFTLLELLVAIVISAIGLLGIARLQLVTLQNNAGSQYRSIAIQIGSDLFERMRANQEGVRSNEYNRPVANVGDPAYNSPVSTCQTAGNCTAAERAATDLAEAMQQARATLPGGAVIVCVDSGSGAAPSFDGTNIVAQCDGLGAALAVKVFWLDDRSNSNAALAAGTFSSFVTRGLP